MRKGIIMAGLAGLLLLFSGGDIKLDRKSISNPSNTQVTQLEINRELDKIIKKAKSGQGGFDKIKDTPRIERYNKANENYVLDIAFNGTNVYFWSYSGSFADEPKNERIIQDFYDTPTIETYIEGQDIGHGNLNKEYGSSYIASNCMHVLRKINSEIESEK